MYICVHILVSVAIGAMGIGLTVAIGAAGSAPLLELHLNSVDSICCCISVLREQSHFSCPQEQVTVIVSETVCYTWTVKFSCVQGCLENMITSVLHGGRVKHLSSNLRDQTWGSKKKACNTCLGVGKRPFCCGKGIVHLVSQDDSRACLGEHTPISCPGRVQTVITYPSLLEGALFWRAVDRAMHTNYSRAAAWVHNLPYHASINLKAFPWECNNIQSSGLDPHFSKIDTGSWNFNKRPFFQLAFPPIQLHP